MFRIMLMSSLVVGAGAAVALADPPARPGQAYVVTRPDPGLAAPRATSQRLRIDGARDKAYLVVHPVVHPEATVSRELSEQPVRPYLAQLHLARTTTVYIDPDVRYDERSPFGIDRNHSLVRAQRQFRDLQARPARVITNPNLPASPPAADAAPAVQPRVIIDLRDLQPDPQGRPVPIPSVPEPPRLKADGKLMVQTH